MNLSFIEFGEKGKTIVFLHGWQQDKKSFIPLVPFLHQKYRLIFIDLPGFGRSPKPNDTFTSFDYAEIIKTWLGQKKLKDIILVGHSFGGKVAAIIASQDTNLVSKLILMTGSGFATPSKFSFRKFFPKPIISFLSPLYIKLFASRDYREAGNLLPIFKNVVKDDLSETFRSLHLPTLILWGQEDKELPVIFGQRIKRHVKGSQLKLLPGGHFFFQEYPQETAEAISQFIGK